MELQEILIDGRNITEFMPHKTPMLMVDALLNLEKERVDTSFFIREDNIFVKNGKFSEAGILENIAQSSTLTVGYDFYISSKEMQRKYFSPFGYIGAINRVSITELPPVGCKIHTVAKIDIKMQGILFVKTDVFLKEKVIASAEMKIFIES